jgi:hypothetical protein
VSDYRLNDRAIGVRSPAGAKEFSSNLRVQTGSGAHQASLYNGYRGSFPRGQKRGRGVTLTTHPHLVPRSRMSRSYTSPPQALPWRLAGLLYLLPLRFAATIHCVFLEAGKKFYNYKLLLFRTIQPGFTRRTQNYEDGRLLGSMS